MARGGSRAEGRFDDGVALSCLVLAVLLLVAPGSVREQFAQTLRNTVLAPLVRLEMHAVAAREAVASREDVLRQRGKGVTDGLAVAAIRDENHQLRRLLGLSARLADGFIAAEVLPLPPGAEAKLLLTAGRQAGVIPFAPVVTGAGLVGMIERVDDRTSEAITWSHPDFRVSAMSRDQVAVGIVQPHRGGAGERVLLEMRGVPFRSAIDTGTLIVSSGLGATYPRGIPIGTVIGEVATTERWARTYLLRPVALDDAVGPVLILLPARAQRGVADVWTTLAGADSAARMAAAAGDSLARSSANDELAARRAAELDTVPPGRASAGAPASVPPRPPVRR